MRGKLRGFTLIELLVVIAIIAILVALLLPAVQQVREAARKSQCQDHLHNYGVALHSYDGDFKSFPIGGTFRVDANFNPIWGSQFPQLSWHARLLTYMEQKPLYDAIDWSLPDARTQNINGTELRRLDLDYALCPSDASGRLNNVWAQTNYGGNLGSQRVSSANTACNIFYTDNVNFENPGGNANHGNTLNKRDISGVFGRMGPSIGLKDMSDGTSNVFLIGEILPACHDHREGMWSFNGDGNAHSGTQVPPNTWTTCVEPYRPNNPEYPACTAQNNWNLSWGFRSAHPGGVQFCMGDDKVTFVSENIDYETYQRLGGRKDGQPVRVP